MDNLRTEYVDIREVKHSVEHLTVPADGRNSREQIVEELLSALTRPDKRTPAWEGGASDGDCPVRQKLGGAGEQHKL